MLPVTIDDIHAAAAALEGQVARTPTIAAPQLSGILGCEIFLKLETLQRTGSFKDRGAYNKLRSLGKAERKRGVVAMSAGNHAQGVAYHATRLGIPSTIVMPTFTPFTKVAKTEGYGARVVLVGQTLDDSMGHARKLVDEEGLTLIHPYDDPHIVAGQGTAGLEMLADVPDLDDIVVPIGGGGLISGIAIAARSIRPSVRITGVEAALYASMSDAVAGRTGIYGGATIAEGIAVKSPGVLTRQIIAELVDDIVTVEETVLEHGVHMLLTQQKLVAEGAGAAGIAGILANPERFAGRRVGVVVCGGNIDPRILASILMRGLVRNGQIARLRIEIEDSPGVLSRIAGIIGAIGGNIIETYHQRLFFQIPVKRADIDVVVETRDRAHVEVIIAKLTAEGYPAKLLGDVGA
ncbi:MULTISPECIES: threonine ammonia-lyase [Inquilinus]|uniref:L-serine dehydratase n=1 Tax=Inquilinus ginsengisoli TaxID=363840 RepID=A0ABU1JRI4_9PROT|nr:threonine ammonia-lyase [Inquilinus ginsengisoli]MDR6291219.1 threonine dehydratase [Inquilinus ginsengisoli]